MDNPFRSTSAEQQQNMVELLRTARHTLGYGVLDDMLPAPFNLAMTHHDTGCQVSIYAKADGLELFPVWEGSIWNTSSHKFNDRGKELGMKANAAFAEPHIRAFFDDVQRAVDAKIAARAVEAKAAADARAARLEATARAYEVLLTKAD